MWLHGRRLRWPGTGETIVLPTTAAPRRNACLGGGHPAISGFTSVRCRRVSARSDRVWGVRMTPPNVVVPKERNLSPDNVKPVFVVGSGRSGTTAVFDSLVQAFDAAFLPRLTRKSKRLARWSVQAATYPALRRATGSILEPCAESPFLYDHPGMRPTDTVVRGRAMRTDEVPEAWSRNASRQIHSTARAFDQPLFVSKSTANCARVRALGTLTPKARVLYVVRDPRAVALSLDRVDFWAEMPLWWLGMRVSEAQSQGQPSIDLALQHWVHQNEAIQEALEDPDVDLDVHQIKYEEFCSAPSETLERIAHWLGVAPDKGRIRTSASDVRPFADPTYPAALTESAVRLTASMAQKLGYEL